MNYLGNGFFESDTEFDPESPGFYSVKFISYVLDESILVNKEDSFHVISLN